MRGCSVVNSLAARTQPRLQGGTSPCNAPRARCWRIPLSLSAAGDEVKVRRSGRWTLLGAQHPRCCSRKSVPSLACTRTAGWNDSGDDVNAKALSISVKSRLLGGDCGMSFNLGGVIKGCSIVLSNLLEASLAFFLYLLTPNLVSLS